MATDEKVIKTFVGTLNRLFNPALVRDAFKAAASEAGLENIETLLPPPPAILKEKGAGKVKKEKKIGPPRKTQPYTIFVSKLMDRIAHEASYTSLTNGPGGVKVNPMTIAGSLWKQLSDKSKEDFAKAYQPLCHQLKVEADVSGHKVENLLQKIKDYDAKLDKATKLLLKPVLPEHLPSSHIAAVAAATPSKAVVVEEDEEEDEDEEDEDEEDEDDEEKKAREAAERLRQEEEERLRKKKEKKEKKRLAAEAEKKEGEGKKSKK